MLDMCNINDGSRVLDVAAGAGEQSVATAKRVGEAGEVLATDISPNYVETPAGRIGALLCWENYMPLARYALYSQGIEIYIAPTYDSGDGWIGTLQHIAREGCCWVVGCGNLMKGSDFPQDFPQKSTLYPDADEWVNPGDSVVIAPGGEIVAGPMREEAGLLYCDIDRDRVSAARRALDVAGHYSRPDIFQLHVNTRAQSPVQFDD